MTQPGHFFTRSSFGKGLPPGSLTQKQIDLLEEPSSSRFVLQKEMIPPRKRYETSTGDPGRHLTARIDRDHEIAAYMHDACWNLAGAIRAHRNYSLLQSSEPRFQVMRSSVEGR